jgi:hypothetical protein
MQRCLAQIALLATCLGPLFPSSSPPQLSSLPACCLRAGKHHCLEPLNPLKYGFHSVHTQCPYSALTRIARSQASHQPTFQLSSPPTRSARIEAGADPLLAATRRQFPARGPPSFFSTIKV